MLANYYNPLITQPTRIEGNSSPTLIDNIFISSLEPSIVSGNLIDKISDHLPNFVFFGENIKPNNKDRTFIRNYRHFNLDKYINEINETNLAAHPNSQENLNHQFEQFHTKIQTVINKHAPLKPKTKQQRKQQLKPWITYGILKSISTKNMLYQKFLKTKDELWFQRYKAFRNTLNHTIRLSKKLHYHSYFETFKSDSKKIWKGINDLLNKKTSNNTESIKLNIRGTLQGDRKTVANAFNHFFTNVAQNLVNKLGHTKKHFKDYLQLLSNPRWKIS